MCGSEAASPSCPLCHLDQSQALLGLLPGLCKHVTSPPLAAIVLGHSSCLPLPPSPPSPPDLSSCKWMDGPSWKSTEAGGASALFSVTVPEAFPQDHSLEGTQMPRNTMPLPQFTGETSPADYGPRGTGSRAASTIPTAKYTAGAMPQTAPRGMSPLQVPQCPGRPHHESPLSNPCSQESSLHPRPASRMPLGRICWEHICILLSLICRAPSKVLDLQLSYSTLSPSPLVLHTASRARVTAVKEDVCVLLSNRDEGERADGKQPPRTQPVSNTQAYPGLHFRTPA